MVGVTTVALLERKPGISRDLFSRYWRDVHGVMAARIPGFASYTQHHVTPGSAASEPFEGIAIVTFANEEDRRGLATSAISGHIHRDEVNVFRRALLYNLAAGADEKIVSGPSATDVFFVVPASVDPYRIAESVRNAGASCLTTYDLTSGDPAAWNETDVDDGGRGRRFVALVHAGWSDETPAARAIADACDLGIAVFQLDETHVMVDRGRATPLGLRGLDMLRTIREAGADNQLDPAVERALYGPFDPPPS